MRKKDRTIEDVEDLQREARAEMDAGRWRRAATTLRRAANHTLIASGHGTAVEPPPSGRISALLEAKDPSRSYSVQIAFAILAAFAPGDTWLGVHQVSDRIGISRSTTHRYMTTLLDLAQLEQGTDRKYRRIYPPAPDELRALIAESEGPPPAKPPAPKRKAPAKRQVKPHARAKAAKS